MARCRSALASGQDHGENIEKGCTPDTQVIAHPAHVCGLSVRLPAQSDSLVRDHCTPNRHRGRNDPGVGVVLPGPVRPFGRSAGDYRRDVPLYFGRRSNDCAGAHSQPSNKVVASEVDLVKNGLRQDHTPARHCLRQRRPNPRKVRDRIVIPPRRDERARVKHEDPLFRRPSCHRAARSASSARSFGNLSIFVPSRALAAPSAEIAPVSTARKTVSMKAGPKRATTFR